MRSRLSLKELEEGLRNGDRSILSKAITLVESTLPDDQSLARDLLQKVMLQTGNSIRIGITGVPGAGKSTLIEAIGKKFTSKGKKVAVLAVDPSSQISGGSILGDKTRMEELSKDPLAFIRPSPTRSGSGGIAQNTRESILLCEAAGYEIIFIETVGVGQVETQVKGLVDFFLLILLTGAGDELQMVKKGIIELADLIVVNKADDLNVEPAESFRKDLEHNLPFLIHPESLWKIQVLTSSAREGKGIDEIIDNILAFEEFTKRKNYFQENRKSQSIAWIRESVIQLFKEEFYNSPEIKKALEKFEKEVVSGRIPATIAAQELIHIFRSAT